MSDELLRHCTTRIDPRDGACGFSCGTHALDEYFARYAFQNDHCGIGRCYVLRNTADPSLPTVVGYYSLSMANVESSLLQPFQEMKMPRYPMPVALIGRLAVDARAQGRRFGEFLLFDAFRKVLGAAETVGCLGVIVDAKDERATAFYDAYDFKLLPGGEASWPRRMFIPLGTIRASFNEK